MKGRLHDLRPRRATQKVSQKIGISGRNLFGVQWDPFAELNTSGFDELALRVGTTDLDMLPPPGWLWDFQLDDVSDVLLNDHFGFATPDEGLGWLVLWASSPSVAAMPATGFEFTIDTAKSLSELYLGFAYEAYLDGGQDWLPVGRVAARSREPHCCCPPAWRFCGCGGGASWPQRGGAP